MDAVFRLEEMGTIKGPVEVDRVVTRLVKRNRLGTSRRVGNDTPELVVTWTSDSAAKAFISAKGIGADYQVVALTEASLNNMAQALGCQADAIAFDAYPG